MGCRQFSAECILWQNAGMPLIQVRDVPEHIYRRLKEMAEREHRSLAQQVVAVLARGLQVEGDAKARRRRILDAALGIDSERVNKMTDPARLIREDRRR